MEVIRVTYTVKQDYVEENKSKIRAVMDELRSLNSPSVKYSSFLLEDGKTFTHVVVYSSEDKGLPSSLESFKSFQSALKENLEVPPKVENLTLVGSSFD